MLKVALKHWLYERCISIIFDRIGFNFNRPNRLSFGGIQGIKIGRGFSRLNFKRCGTKKCTYYQYSHGTIWGMGEIGVFVAYRKITIWEKMEDGSFRTTLTESYDEEAGFRRFVRYDEIYALMYDD